MDIELSAQSEKIVPYKYFGDGRVIDLMPKLIEAGYKPAGVSVLIDRRQYAPEEVRNNFNACFFTGDSVVMDEKGGALLTLDSHILQQLTPKSPLIYGGLKLEQKQWKELKADKEHSLYLTYKEVKKAHGKGYVLKNGKCVPANRTVAKVWDFMNKGKELQTYAEMVSEISSEISKSKYCMRLYFDNSNQDHLTLWSFALDKIDSYSVAYGNLYLYNNSGRLVGVPEAHITREKVLEAMVTNSLKNLNEAMVTNALKNLKSL